jgi:hypothetical protein
MGLLLCELSKRVPADVVRPSALISSSLFIFQSLFVGPSQVKLKHLRYTLLDVSRILRQGFDTLLCPSRYEFR